ncbi:MAG: hypothetical protein IPN97_06935 [Saprospiraceae bacterium]|nr:hypothetical protein [Saprospiraceae bacterium]
MLKYSVLVYFLLGIVSVALGQETDKDVRYITKDGNIMTVVEMLPL